MSLTLFVDDICPRCRKPVKLAVIEPHPTRRDLAIHNFHCVDCGSVKARIISLKSGKPPAEAALRREEAASGFGG
jgi:hypothetical protein